MKRDKWGAGTILLWAYSTISTCLLILLFAIVGLVSPKDQEMLIGGLMVLSGLIPTLIFMILQGIKNLNK